MVPSGLVAALGYSPLVRTLAFKAASSFLARYAWILVVTNQRTNNATR